MVLEVLKRAGTGLKCPLSVACRMSRSLELGNQLVLVGDDPPCFAQPILCRDQSRLFSGHASCAITGVLMCRKVGYKRTMTKPQSPPFKCPNCGALYEVVRVEAAPANDPEITCRSCGGPLPGREAGLVLKYFLVARPGERSYVELSQDCHGSL